MDLTNLPLVYAGVDEAGRGPLAGPVVAAAVILNPADPITGITDSKLLSPKRREILAEAIKTRALAWGLGRAEVEEIDTLNILQASLLAMQRAVAHLKLAPELVLVDGNRCPQLPFAAKAVIGGDRIVPAVAAASILAKVTRDAEMVLYDAQYPGYEFAIHKGYPTVKHRRLLSMLGASPVHRRSFSPVRLCLSGELAIERN